MRQNAACYITYYSLLITPRALARVELHDHVLVECLVAVLAGGQGEDAAGHGGVIARQPLRRLAAVAHRLLHRLEVLRLAPALRPAERVAHLDVRRADVGLAAVEGDVAVIDDLARLVARVRPAEAHDSVVEARLQHPDEVIARDAGHVVRLLEVIAELA